MISVIIPVYNAEAFIIKAINSAIQQKEVSEIIVVDDGSKDESLKLCNEFAQKNPRVKVFFHKNHCNLGRSVTRNIGLIKAKSPYIAFLDADDYYLPFRFTKDIEILEKQQEIDGVYNAISAHYYREASSKEFEKLKLTTIREVVPSDKLFELMGPMGHLGYFSGIGLTVRRNIFKKCGYFNEKLVVAEDTELWLKMSLVSNLVGGILNEPVSMRGVHQNNVSFKSLELYNHNYLKMYNSLYSWSKYNEMNNSRLSLLWKKVWEYRRINKTSFHDDLSFWFNELISKPHLIFLKSNLKTFPLFWRLKKIILKF